MDTKSRTGPQGNSAAEFPPFDGLFRPRGPFPWFLHDFERDTVGWSGDLRYAYLRLLAHLWSQGGIVPNDDAYLAEAAGLNRCRGYREKLVQLRSKLTPISQSIGEKFAESSAIELPNRSDPNFEFVTQKRVLRELEKAKARSSLARNAAKKRWGQEDADGMDDEPNSAMPPSLSHNVSTTESISETPRDTPDDRAAAFAAARELFPNQDSGALVARLIQSEGATGALTLIERARDTRDPWRYLWACISRRAAPATSQQRPSLSAAFDELEVERQSRLASGGEVTFDGEYVEMPND